jgi:hypothetical protein
MTLQEKQKSIATSPATFKSLHGAAMATMSFTLAPEIIISMVDRGATKLPAFGSGLSALRAAIWAAALPMALRDA